VSGGLNFLGRSSLAVFRCGHDADWHTALGGYGRCIAPEAQRPLLRETGSGLMLLSSFAHPMYLGWRLHGTHEEAKALRMAAEAAESIGGGYPRTWRPHPSFRRLPRQQRDELARLAASLGFAMAEPGEAMVGAASRHRWVVSTESTAILELLRSGILPVMIPSVWGDSGSAFARYANCARTGKELAERLSVLSDPSAAESMYSDVWNSVRPAADWSSMDRSHFLPRQREETAEMPR
jgi:hypothetical protein